MELTILVTNGTCIELLIGTFENTPYAGEDVPRDPRIDPGDWKVAKVFVFEEAKKIDALIVVMGREAVKELFKITGLLEVQVVPSFHNYERKDAYA